MSRMGSPSGMVRMLPRVMISLMSADWVPMRWASVTIFSAEDTVRKSLATGCWCSRSLRQMLSMSRSFWVTWFNSSGSSLARATSQVNRAWEVFAMAFSQSMPMVVISFFSSSSCMSNLERIIQTSP